MRVSSLLHGGVRYLAYFASPVLLRLLCLCLLLPIAAAWAQPALAPGEQAGEAGSYPFSVVTERDSGGHRMVARNEGPAPVSIRVKLLDSDNAVIEGILPIFTVVAPYETKMLVRVKPLMTSQRYSFRFQNAWLMGDFRARPDPMALYRLPYKEGQSFRVSQADGGVMTTHTRPDSKYAIDFSMPEQTRIVAARDGVVVKSVGSQVAGGLEASLLNKANVIRILHNDGSIATYAHLAYGGNFVYPGQRVVAGQEIGLSGNTGYSSGPHLHFAVLRIERDGDTMRAISVPVQFYVGSPPTTFTLRQGMKVMADYPVTTRRVASGY